MKALSIEFNEEHTIRWWERLLKDEDSMNRWLSKLWNTEKNGYDGDIRSAGKYTQEGSEAREIFHKIAKEELSHSELLFDLLQKRGVTPVAEEQPGSAYWPHVMKGITDLKSCAAAMAIGESLAARRFRVIQEHPDTPQDILDFINKALPDEEGHCRDFQKIAGDEAIKNAVSRHNEAVALIQSSP